MFGVTGARRRATKRSSVRLERHNRAMQTGRSRLVQLRPTGTSVDKHRDNSWRRNFLLKDFARYCDNDRVSRRLRDVADDFRTSRRSIVILAASIFLPPELSADAVEFALGLPSADELLRGVKCTIVELASTHGVQSALDAAAMGELAKNLTGLPEEEALRVLRQCVLTRGKADPALLADVLEAKRQALRTEGLLETVKRDASFHDVAGLQHLREWIAKRKSAWTAEGQRFGLVPPKGILIMGVQG